MMQKLERLVDLAITYLEQNIQTTDAVPATEKPARARKAKAQAESPATASETIAAAPDALLGMMSEKAPAASPAIAQMSEEESAQKVYIVAADFVKRFAKSLPDGRTTALKILADDFEMTSIAELKRHSQRLQFMQKLLAKIADADKAPA